MKQISATIAIGATALRHDGSSPVMDLAIDPAQLAGGTIRLIGTPDPGSRIASLSVIMPSLRPV